MVEKHFTHMILIYFIKYMQENFLFGKVGGPSFLFLFFRVSYMYEIYLITSTVHMANLKLG